MVLKCQDVWKAISDYLEDDLDPELRESLEAHLAQCVHCAALLDSTHNVLVLIADKRMFTLPIGFNERLMERLDRELAR